jgi:hypothetical protein
MKYSERDENVLQGRVFVERMLKFRLPYHVEQLNVCLLLTGYPVPESLLFSSQVPPIRANIACIQSK